MVLWRGKFWSKIRIKKKLIPRSIFVIILTKRDIIRLNPLATILEHNVQILYEHPLVKQYIALKFRQDYLLVWTILKLIMYLGFVLFLNCYAFSLVPPWKLTASNNTHWVADPEDFCVGKGKYTLRYASD